MAIYSSVAGEVYGPCSKNDRNLAFVTRSLYKALRDQAEPFYGRKTAKVSSPLNSNLILDTNRAEMQAGDYDYFLLKGREVSFTHGAKT